MGSGSVKRIDAIDSCRGMMLVLMTLTHLLVFPFRSIHFLVSYAYGPLGFFTDPEGFFFLSGLVASLVYGRMFLAGREKEATGRILGRMGQIYLWQAGLIMAISLCFFFFPSYVEAWKELHHLIENGKREFIFFFDHPFQGFFLGASFLYLLPFLDLLPCYLFFLTLSIPLFYLLKHGKMVLVALGSAGVWGMAQFIPSATYEKGLKFLFPHVYLGWFDLFAWQFMFICGLIFGYLKITNRLRHPHFLLTLFCLLFALICFYLKHWGSSFPSLTNTEKLGILRIMNFAAFAITVWSFHSWFTFRPLAYLGRHSLPVFSYHVLLAYVLVFFRTAITSLSFPTTLSLLFICVASLWIPAYFSERKQSKRSIRLVKN